MFKTSIEGRLMRERAKQYHRGGVEEEREVTMLTETKCPKCGADDCSSWTDYVAYVAKRFVYAQTPGCRINELEHRLRELLERERAKDERATSLEIVNVGF